MRVLVLQVGQEFYALPLETVQQVINKPRITHVPTAHAGLLGLVNVRGEIVPLFDTAALTGAGELPDPAFAVLVTTPQGPLALAADAMPVADEIDEPVAASERPGERGVYASDGGLVILLAIEELLAGKVALPQAS